jgi:hypothetical protein
MPETSTIIGGVAVAGGIAYWMYTRAPTPEEKRAMVIKGLEANSAQAHNPLITRVNTKAAAQIAGPEQYAQVHNILFGRYVQAGIMSAPPK